VDSESALARLTLVAATHASIFVLYLALKEEAMVGVAGWCGLVGVTATIALSWRRIDEIAPAPPYPSPF
jgi:hypothetical protein